jgi:small subunit ribosomal protein S20
MANHVSSLKRARQTETRTEVNRSNRSRVRTSLRDLREALAKGDVKAAQAPVSRTPSPRLDKERAEGTNPAPRQHRFLATRADRAHKAGRKMKLRACASEKCSHCNPAPMFHGIGPCSNGVYLDAVLDGQNVELFGNLDKHQSEQIELGDYLAMLPQKPPYAGLAVVGQRYYVLLPDRSAWVCHITGLSE